MRLCTELSRKARASQVAQAMHAEGYDKLLIGAIGALAVRMVNLGLCEQTLSRLS